MKTLIAFPGRAGDILWGLPSVRAISEAVGQPVDMVIGGEFASLVPLLQHQSYLGKVWSDLTWGLTPPEEWQPPAPNIVGYDRAWLLGYRGWPDQPLAQYTYARAQVETGLPLPPLDLDTPWITIPPSPGCTRVVCCGWSDCWFELKVGLTQLVRARGVGRYRSGDSMRSGTWHISRAPGSRWAMERQESTTPLPAGAGETWVRSAQWIQGARVFLGDCSALHVLAVGLGRQVVVVEPMTARHNLIFYPLGTTGRVRLVTGNDQLPSFDARHTADVLEEVLSVQTFQSGGR